MAQKRKIPLRKSVVSNKIFPKRELLRIVKNKNEEIFIDPTGRANGRGAYIAFSMAEVEKVRGKKILERVFQTNLADDFYEKLLAHVECVLRREVEQKR